MHPMEISKGNEKYRFSDGLDDIRAPSQYKDRLSQVWDSYVKDKSSSSSSKLYFGQAIQK